MTSLFMFAMPGQDAETVALEGKESCPEARCESRDEWDDGPDEIGGVRGAESLLDRGSSTRIRSRRRNMVLGLGEGDDYSTEGG